MNRYICSDLSGNYDENMPKEIYIATYISYSIRSISHDRMIPEIFNSNFKNLNTAIEHVLLEIDEIDNEFTSGIWIEPYQNITKTISNINVDSVKQKILEEGEIIFKMEQNDQIDHTIYHVFKISCIDLL